MIPCTVLEERRLPSGDHSPKSCPALLTNRRRGGVVLIRCSHLGRPAPRCGQAPKSARAILGEHRAAYPHCPLGPRRPYRTQYNLIQFQSRRRTMNRADPTTAETNFLSATDRELSVEEVAEIQALDATMAGTESSAPRSGIFRNSNHRNRTKTS